MNKISSGITGSIAVAAAMLLAAGCAMVGSTAGMPSEPTSVQTIEYYPFQVKGYQSTYPRRSAVVLLPLDARQLSGPNTQPLGDEPAVGVITDRSEQVLQRLYSKPLPPIVQTAVGRSAEEAGMTSSADTNSEYQRTAKADYVIASRITRCWVKKHRGPDGSFGPTWSTEADFALEVVIYKPPFKVPFWQGTSSSTYYDPPIGSFGLGPEDEAGIYDDPGQVLSVALTRAVAGIFQRDDLHTLIAQDPIVRH